MRGLSLLPLLLFAACASTGPTRWKGLESLTTKPNVSRLERAKDAGELQYIVQKGAWFWAGGFKDGPVVDVEWFGKDLVIAKPRWGTANTAAAQAAQLGTRVTGCEATMYRQIRGYDFNAVPGAERLCWTDDPELLVTQKDDQYERIIWIPGGHVAAPDKTPFKPGSPLSSLVRPLCDGCNTGTGGTFYMTDEAIAAWRASTNIDAMRVEQDELFLGYFDWLGLDAAAQKILDQTSAEEQAAEKRRASDLSADRARVSVAIETMASLERAPLPRRLKEYGRLSHTIADILRLGGDIDKWTDRLVSIDESISDAVEHGLEKAEKDQRVATAAYLRLLADRLRNIELPGHIGIRDAIAGGDTNLARSRRELARLAVSLLPTFSGSVDYAEAAYWAGDLLDHSIRLEAAEFASLDGTHAPWKLEVSKPTRGGRPCPPGEAEVLLWQAKLDRLATRIEAHRAALANLRKILKDPRVKWHQEKMTLGAPPYAFQFTLDRRDDPGLALLTQAVSPDLQLISDHEGQLEGLFEEYNTMARRAPAASSKVPSGSGPLQRTVRLTIDGKTETLAQVVNDDSPESLSAKGFARLSDELAALLLRELRTFVEKQIAARLSLYGHIWSKDEREFEEALLRSIYISEDKTIDSPLVYRALVPNP